MENITKQMRTVEKKRKNAAAKDPGGKQDKHKNISMENVATVH